MSDDESFSSCFLLKRCVVLLFFLLQLEKHDKGEIRVTELRPLEEMKEEAESYRSVIRGFDV